jgi:hypothetical protein
MRHNQTIEHGKAHIIFDIKMPHDRAGTASAVAAGEITVPQRDAFTLAEDMAHGHPSSLLDSYREAIDSASRYHGGKWAGAGFGVLIHYCSGYARYVR